MADTGELVIAGTRRILVEQADGDDSLVGLVTGNRHRFIEVRGVVLAGFREEAVDAGSDRNTIFML